MYAYTWVCIIHAHCILQEATFDLQPVGIIYLGKQPTPFSQAAEIKKLQSCLATRFNHADSCLQAHEAVYCTCSELHFLCMRSYCDWACPLRMLGINYDQLNLIYIMIPLSIIIIERSCHDSCIAQAFYLLELVYLVHLKIFTDTLI